MLEAVYTRISEWNRLRYPRVYDTPLTVALLSEEFYETMMADSVVERVDGYCDQLFVALGAVWKLDVEDSLIAECVAWVTKTMDIESCDSTIAYNIVMLHPSPSKETRLANLIAIACAATVGLQRLGLSEEQAMRCIAAVCTSNESKSIQKTDPTVKANKDKGEFYTPPTIALNKILGELACQSTQH